jgi:RNA polymerase sigma factor (sigma-70 family)
MSVGERFDELLERVRRGEPNAAYELVRRYESAVRVAIRTRLSDPALRQQFDSMDICQSVLASFFLRAAAGEYDLNEPGQLVALLTKMAHNKLAMHARGHYRQRRDVRRASSMSDDWSAPIDKALGPDEQVINRDLIHRAYALMEPEVRQMANCRVYGTEWSEIAAQLGGTAEARRKQFRRAMADIAQSLEIE